jgi:hypothetical protein
MITEEPRVIMYPNKIKICKPGDQQKLKNFHALYYSTVTFQDLQKPIQSQQQSDPEQSQLLLRPKDKSFWISDFGKHKAERI